MVEHEVHGYQLNFIFTDVYDDVIMEDTNHVYVRAWRTTTNHVNEV